MVERAQEKTRGALPRDQSTIRRGKTSNYMQVGETSVSREYIQEMESTGGKVNELDSVEIQLSRRRSCTMEVLHLSK